MDRKLIDAYRFEEELYHEAFERDSGMQRWDSGCWIRYKLFERMLEKQPAVDAVPVIRCKDCRHRPHKDEAGNVIPHNVELDPCPCVCNDDWFYNWMPEDNFYCGSGQPKEDEG